MGHIFRLVTVLAVALDVHGVDLHLAGVFAGCRNKTAIAFKQLVLWHAGEIACQNAVDRQIWIASDWRGEVGVIIQHQTKMSDIFFRVNRLGHGAQQLIVDDRFQLGAAHTLQNIRKIFGLWIFQQPVRADVQVFQQLVQQIDLDGLWTVMDAVDKRQLLLNREGRSRLICGEHKFLDHPLAFSGRAGHDVLDLSVLDDKFGLVGADVHRPAVKAPLAQNLC